MAGFFNVPIRRQQILLFVVDIGLLLVSLMLAMVIARFAQFDILLVIERIPVALFLYFSIYVLVFFIGQLYDVESRYDEMRSFLYICGQVAASTLLIALAYSFVPALTISRRVLAIQAPLTVILIYLWRRIYALVSRGLVSAHRVLLLGANESTASLLEDLRNGYDRELTITGILDDDPAKLGRGFGGVPVLGDSFQLKEIVERQKIETIVFSPGYRSSADGHTVRGVLDLKSRGIKVYELPTFYMRVTGKVPVRFIEDQWLLFSQDFTGIARADERNLKRLMDIALTLLALVLLAPVAIVLAVLVKATSRGPVLYRQERVGLDKRPYSLLKFRTMRDDAEGTGPPQWASRDDQRVTPLGRFMRRFRLDEIPQFINILRGEMSVIGPRPERPYFVDRLERDIPYYALRFAARPGLTGWAQVNYPYGATVDDAHAKLQYDLYYVQEMSPLLDLVILLKTFQTLLYKPGS